MTAKIDKKKTSKVSTKKKPVKAKKSAPRKTTAKKEPKVKGKAGKKDKGTEIELPKSIVPHTGKETFAAVRQKVFEFRSAIDSARWDLSAALFKVNDETLYAHWGYPSWEAYIKNEVGMTVRTAHYLVSMYGYFQIDLLEDVSGLPKNDATRKKAVKRRDEIVKRLQDLGWTKGKCLVGILNRDNADEWLDKAKKMSTSELEAEAKRALNAAQGIEDVVETMKNVSFKLAEAQIEPVENALEMAGGMLESTKRGHQLSMICTDFIASNMAQKGKGKDRMGSYLNKVGSMYNVRLIAVDKETGKVVHNDELFQKMKSE